VALWSSSIVIDQGVAPLQKLNSAQAARQSLRSERFNSQLFARNFGIPNNTIRFSTWQVANASTYWVSKRQAVNLILTSNLKCEAEFSARFCRVALLDARHTSERRR